MRDKWDLPLALIFEEILEIEPKPKQEPKRDGRDKAAEAETEPKGKKPTS